MSIDPLVQVAFLTTIGGMVNWFLTNRIGKKVEMNDIKTDNLVAKTKEIHDITNSNFTKVSTDLQVATARIAGLEALVLSLNARISDLTGKRVDIVEEI